MGLKASCFYNVTKESDDLFLGVVWGGLPRRQTALDGSRGNVRSAKLPGCTRESIVQRCPVPFQFRGLSRVLFSPSGVP